MYVCMSVCVCVYIYIYTHIQVCVCVCVVYKVRELKFGVIDIKFCCFYK